MLIFGYSVKQYLQAEVAASQHLPVKNHSDKHHIFAPTSGARCAIFAKLCMVIELVETKEVLKISRRAGQPPAPAPLWHTLRRAGCHVTTV